MQAPETWLFPLFTDHHTYDRSMARLSDVHLYTGSRCNRTCGFCIVEGRPQGWHQPLSEAALDAALALVPCDGTIKFYGGEPTLDLPNLLWSMTYLRLKGFEGWFTIFTNGVQADRVLAALEHDAHTDVVLNYSILHGIDAEPLPAAALAKLRAYADTHPGRIFSSHAGVFPFGPGARFADEVGGAHLADRMATSVAMKLASGHVSPESATVAATRNYRICPRCRPVVTSDGRHHACPFAVESTSPHFDLGRIDEPAAAVLQRYQQFLDWIGQVLEPEAERRQIHPCRVCTEGLAPLPVYRTARRDGGQVGA